MQISVIGLGSLGRTIARNLLRKQHRVAVWDGSPDPVAELVRDGAVPLSRDKILAVDIALSTLSGDSAVRANLLDETLLRGARPGLIHASMAAISPALAQELADVYAAYGITSVAAPMFRQLNVTGGTALDLMTAGDPVALDRLDSVFQILGNTWRIGTDPALAHLGKIASDIMVGGTLEAMAEAISLFDAYGSTPRGFFAIVAEALLDAPFYRFYGEAMAAGRSTRVLKDLATARSDMSRAQAVAGEAELALPLVALVEERLDAAAELKMEQEDWTVALARLARHHRAA